MDIGTNLSTFENVPDILHSPLCRKCSVEFLATLQQWEPRSYQYIYAIVIVTVNITQGDNATSWSTAFNPSTLDMKTDYASTFIDVSVVDDFKLVSV